MARAQSSALYYIPALRVPSKTLFALISPHRLVNCISSIIDCPAVSSMPSIPPSSQTPNYGGANCNYMKPASASSSTAQTPILCIQRLSRTNSPSTHAQAKSIAKDRYFYASQMLKIGRVNLVSLCLTVVFMDCCECRQQKHVKELHTTNHRQTNMKQDGHEPQMTHE